MSEREDLQERIYREIVEFEKRLDAMETRHEENCRVLAFRLAELVEREIARRGEGTDPA